MEVDAVMSMNVLGSSSSTSMLNMLSSGKQSGADAIIAANIKARRERVNKIIEKYTNTSMTTDTEKYEKVATEAKDTEKLLDALKDPELYKEEATTIDKVVSKYAEKYNSLITNMKKLGGNIEKVYGPKLTEAFKENEDKLKEIGFTMELDGKLTKKDAAIKPVEGDKVKAVFGTDTSYGAKIKKTLSDASEILNKALKIKQAQSTNYGKSGTYINQLINSTINAKA